jgi:hypothetical protein
MSSNHDSNGIRYVQKGVRPIFPPPISQGLMYTFGSRTIQTTTADQVSHRSRSQRPFPPFSHTS